jgi:hypothetical protein
MHRGAVFFEPIQTTFDSLVNRTGVGSARNQEPEKSEFFLRGSGTKKVPAPQHNNNIPVQF